MKSTIRKRDVPHLLRETVRQWYAEDLTRLGAALAYYAAFSFVPLLLIGTSIAGLLFGEQQVENQLVQRIVELIGSESGQTIRDSVQAITGDANRSGLTTVLSVVALIFGATGLFRHLKESLNIIWSVPPAERNKVRGFIRDSVLALLMMVGLGVLLIGVLILNTALLSLVESIIADAPQLQWIRHVAGVALMIAVMTLVFAALFKSLPDAHVTWRDVWVGAAVTALLFTIGQFVLGLFLRNNTLDTIYGAASTFVLILIWVHITAHVVLFGAEFTQVYANEYGAKITADNPTPSGLD
jgi:membrane protein